MLQFAEVILRDVHFVEEDLARIEGDAAQGGITHSAGLLKDFFEHEMLEATLLRHDGVPSDVLYLTSNGIAVKVGQLDALRSDHREVAVAEEEKVTGVIQDGRYVASDEVFVT